MRLAASRLRFLTATRLTGVLATSVLVAACSGGGDTGVLPGMQAAQQSFHETQRRGCTAYQATQNAVVQQNIADTSDARARGWGREVTRWVGIMQGVSANAGQAGFAVRVDAGTATFSGPVAERSALARDLGLLRIGDTVMFTVTGLAATTSSGAGTLCSPTYTADWLRILSVPRAPGDIGAAAR